MALDLTPKPPDLAELARQAYWRSIWQWDHQLWVDPWVFWGIGALVLLVAGLGVRSWWKRRHLRPRPLATFNAVAVALNLSLRERLLLVRISRNQKLPTPLTLMLSPATFQHHAQRYVQAAFRFRRAPVAIATQRLQASVFGDSQLLADVIRG